jgi:hypothetical protein
VPTPRLAGDLDAFTLKNGPCGQSANGRSENVSEFAPGETITVTIDEYIAHPGYFRVAFDEDGDGDFPIRTDMDSVNASTDDPESVNPLDGATILGYSYEAGSMGEHSLQVTLPNVECENCTLQVIQFMYDKLGNNMDDEYYYQCADLVLRGDGGGAGGATGTSSTTGVGGTGTASTSSGDATTGMGMGGASSTTGGMALGGASSTTTTSTTMAAVGTTGAPATTTAGVGGTATSAGTMGSTATGVGGSGLGDPVTAEPASGDEGCSCRVVGYQARGGLVLPPMALGLWWARRRRR